MDRRRVSVARIESSVNPLWVIAAAMAIFFAAVAAVIALG